MYPMPVSPGGHIIEHIEGDPSAIIARGKEIESLGEMMRRSGETLSAIQMRAETQQGKAVTSLRESIGDSSGVLGRAADLYEPVGPVVQTYGEELEELKTSLNNHVDECQELWNTYVELPGSVEPRGVGGMFQPEEDSPEAETQADEDAAKKEAYEAWEEEARLFDKDYDAWETAFDTATDGVTDEMAGEIKDGFWTSLVDLLGLHASGEGAVKPETNAGTSSWHGPGGAGGKAEASAVAGPRASGKVGSEALGLTAEGGAGLTAEAQASAEAEVGPNGVSAKAGASAQAGGYAKGEVTSEHGPMSHTTSGEVFAGAKAGVDGGLDVGPTGVSAEAGAKAFAGAEAKAETGYEFFGLSIGGKAGVTAGAGAEATGKFETSADGFQLKFGAKAAVGLGASGGLDLGFSAEEFNKDLESLWPF
ncbi:MAG TPA: hypothetical protein VK060_14730 [Ruania sp.]|nr:hypothetical protein [Ruania sp.]